LNRGGIAEAGLVAVLGLLLLAGAVGIYDYTAAPSTRVSATTSDSSAGDASSSTAKAQTSAAAQAGPSGGTCARNSAGQCIVPEGVWADYLGYIPQGYTLAPHNANVPDYPCPSGMDATECAVFQQSCGNAVCDPNETCATCPIDCGIGGVKGVSPPSNLVCDPYTGRPELPGTTPISVCQVTTIGN
jgi:hypothetical protein